MYTRIILSFPRAHEHPAYEAALAKLSPIAREKYEYMQAGLADNNFGTTPMLCVDNDTGTVQWQLYNDSRHVDEIHGTGVLTCFAQIKEVH